MDSFAFDSRSMDADMSFNFWPTSPLGLSASGKGMTSIPGRVVTSEGPSACFSMASHCFNPPNPD